MFEEIRDRISALFSSRWLTAAGEITAVRFLGHPGGVVVEYKFSLKDDGPFVGEDRLRNIMDIHTTLPIGGAVTVRYRPDNPSENSLDLESSEGL